MQEPSEQVKLLAAVSSSRDGAVSTVLKGTIKLVFYCALALRGCETGAEKRRRSKGGSISCRLFLFVFLSVSLLDWPLTLSLSLYLCLSLLL